MKALYPVLLIGLFAIGVMFSLASRSDHPQKKVFRYISYGLYVLLLVLANVWLL